MEKQLFNWEEFDIVSDASYMFYKCTLKQNIGTYKIGDEFDCIIVDYEKGKLTISGEVFKLKLVIEEE